MKKNYKYNRKKLKVNDIFDPTCALSDIKVTILKKKIDKLTNWFDKVLIEQNKSCTWDIFLYICRRLSKFWVL